MECALPLVPPASCNNPAMKNIHIVYHDAGGGHRNTAIALQTIIARQNRPWQVRLVQFQDLTDRLDVLRRLAGIRIQEQYNILLQNGWTLGSEYLLRILQTAIRVFHRPLVRLLEDYWRSNPADLLVSVIPHFNRQIYQSWAAVYPGRPFVTLMTDLADFPPRFWIEPIPQQYVIAGTEKAVEQARAFGRDDAHIFATSGMVLRPDFYADDEIDSLELRKSLGLQPDLATAVVLFGGHGSGVIYGVAEKIHEARLPLQLILICGWNQELAAKLRSRRWNLPVCIVGFTKDVHKLMRAADFLIGKPGPGSIAEAMVCRLPVIIERNARTLPQERYNAQWVEEKRVGIVLRSFRDVVSGVTSMLDPSRLAEFRRHVSALNNRAVFEVPEIFARLLGEFPARSASTIQKQPPALMAIS